METINNFYVYIHRRLDNNSIFYVGKGKGNRAFALNGRNKYWNNIVNKCGFKSEILYDNLEEQKALDLETKTIQEIGRKNLCNMTDGGEGLSGHKQSEEHKRKIRESNTGKKRSEEAKLKISLSCKGKIMSKETKIKISKFQKGRTHTKETKLKISLGHINKKLSEEHKRKISEFQIGRESIRKGCKYGALSETHKIKISESLKGHKHSEETKRKMSETKQLKRKMRIN